MTENLDTANSDVSARRSGLSARAVVVSLVCVVLLSILSPYVEFVVAATQIGSIAPPPGPIILLFALVLALNPTLRLFRIRPLGRDELIVVYCVLLAVAVIPSCQFAQWVFSVTTGPFYYATFENKWAEYNWMMPTWWGPRDTWVIRTFYEGLPPGTSIPWAAWFKPLLAFGTLVSLFYVCLLSILTLVRKQWIERERLAFPLVQLPMQLVGVVEETGRVIPSFLRNRVLWLGALLPIIVHSINGLHFHFPYFPQIQLQYIPLGTYFTGRCWNCVNPLFVCIHFCLIGFAFMSGRDVPFSIVFFFLLNTLS